MTKRKDRSTHKSRLPKYFAGSTSETESFDPSVEDWKRFEETLGVQLRDHDRATITEIVENYIDWAQVEIDAPTVHDVLRSLDRFSRAAMALGVLLVETEDRTLSDAQRWALASAGWNMRLSTEGRHTISSLSEGLIAFFNGTQGSIAEIKQHTQEGDLVSEGDAWISLIGRLWNLALARGWKPSASKGQRTSRLGSHSRFAEFIYALQECLPQRLRRYAASKESLAKEILRARKMFGVQSGFDGYFTLTSGDQVAPESK